MAENGRPETSKKEIDLSGAIERALVPLLDLMGTRDNTVKDPMARATLERCQRKISLALHGRAIGIIVEN
jgi:hypothetical protein